MRKVIEIDLAPRVDWLNSVYHKQLTVEACFCELFDNAFDQDATMIQAIPGIDSIIALDLEHRRRTI
jgi:hypothetical protein